MPSASWLRHCLVAEAYGMVTLVLSQFLDSNLSQLYFKTVHEFLFSSCKAFHLPHHLHALSTHNLPWSTFLKTERGQL